jgi:hypothetical protein
MEVFVLTATFKERAGTDKFRQEFEKKNIPFSIVRYEVK